MTKYYRVPAAYVWGMERCLAYPESNDPEALQFYLRRQALARSKPLKKTNKARRKLRNWDRKYSPPTHFYYMSEESLNVGNGWAWTAPFSTAERLAVAEPVDFQPPPSEPFWGTDRKIKPIRLIGITP